MTDAYGKGSNRASLTRILFRSKNIHARHGFLEAHWCFFSSSWDTNINDPLKINVCINILAPSVHVSKRLFFLLFFFFYFVFCKFSDKKNSGENKWLVYKGFKSGHKIHFGSKKLVQNMNELCELTASGCQTLMLKHLHFLLKPQGCWMFPDLSSLSCSCQLLPSIKRLSSALHHAALLISRCSAQLIPC